MEVSLALAFAAGLLSFVSPCVLALVPVYLAFLGESAGAPRLQVAGATNAASATATASAWRTPVLGQAILFVSGFALLFVVLGVSVGLLGGALFRVPEVRQLAGGLVVAIGAVTTGAFGPILDRWRVVLPAGLLPSTRGLRAATLGALVAIGWTPCIGPVLGAILTMGASASDVWVAALLLVAYSAGLAVPFLAAALALPRVKPLLDALRRHHGAVRVVSGVFIMGVGVLIATNAFASMAGWFTFFI